MKHVEGTIERILFLDQAPNPPSCWKLSWSERQGTGRKRISSWKLKAVALYKRGNPDRSCEGEQCLKGVVSSVFWKAEEGHVDWLKRQLHQIGEIGYERY